MSRWVCPNCEREFGRANQGHTCVPGITVEELLGRHPERFTEIYERILDALRPLGPVHEDAVEIGVFLKSDRKIAEFRPQVRAVQLYLVLPEPRADPRVQRVMPGGDRHWHVIKLREPDDVDEQLRDWLAEAYDFGTD
jgi:hypothetical protein